LQLTLIGIGTGNPDHLTREAVRALNASDLILVPFKGAGKADLADVRRAILAEVLNSPVQVAEFDLPARDPATPDYLSSVNDWHEAIAVTWSRTIAAHPGVQNVALMVWGDPSLYDSSLRIAAHLSQSGMLVQTRVVPGITSLQVLTAAHAIPLNSLGAPVIITTGRRLRDHGWPVGADSVAVMLDAGGAFNVLDPTGITIWWGAYVGLPQQTLLHGPLDVIGPTIITTRAALRATHGWIMDIYLMQRTTSDV